MQTNRGLSSKESSLEMWLIIQCYWFIWQRYVWPVFTKWVASALFECFELYIPHYSMFNYRPNELLFIKIYLVFA